MPNRRVDSNRSFGVTTEFFGMAKSPQLEKLGENCIVAVDTGEKDRHLISTWFRIYRIKAGGFVGMGSLWQLRVLGLNLEALNRKTAPGHVTLPAKDPATDDPPCYPRTQTQNPRDPGSATPSNPHFATEELSSNARNQETSG